MYNVTCEYGILLILAVLLPWLLVQVPCISLWRPHAAGQAIKRQRWQARWCRAPAASQPDGLCAVLIATERPQPFTQRPGQAGWPRHRVHIQGGGLQL